MAKNTIFSYLFGKLFGLKCKKAPITLLFDENVDNKIQAPFGVADFTNETQQEATNVFNQQVAGWSQQYSIDKIVGEVLWSDEDHLIGHGEVSATYNITPLHAFDDQAGHGDYYIVDATYTIQNKDMYQPNHANYHGGVRVRIGGFCLTRCNIETTIYDKNGKIDGVKLFASSPKPETFIQEKTYTINDSWNIGGSITGGIKKSAGEKGGTPESSIEGSGSVSFNWGVAHSKSESYKVSDLTIRNNSNVDNVAYELINNNVTHFDWGCDYGLSDCSDFAKSSLIFHSSWIWYIPGAHDNDENNKLTIKTKMAPCYRSCRFYSTHADYDEWHDTFQTSGEIEIELPNRQPTGIVTIKNDTDGTISNVVLYDGNGNIAYKSQSSYAKGETAKYCMPCGTFTIEYQQGKKASEMKTYRYATHDNFEINRGETLNLVSTFDFDIKK